MSHIKKLAVLLLVSVLCAPLAFSQLRFGLEGGIGLANLLYEDPRPYDEDPQDFTLVFRGGGMVEYDIAESVGISSGLMLVGKGIQYKEEMDDYSVRYSTRPYYLQVPLRVYLRGKGVYAAIGPYAAYGLFGNTKAKMIPNDNDERKSAVTQQLRFGNDRDDDWRSFNFGATVVFGFETKTGIRFLVHAEHGFSNVLPKDWEGESDLKKVRAYSIGLTSMYMFN